MDDHTSNNKHTQVKIFSKKLIMNEKIKRQYYWHFLQFSSRVARSFFSSERRLANRVRASAFVPSASIVSHLPVIKFVLETGFSNNLFPISTSLCRFLFVAISTDDSLPIKLSSFKKKKFSIRHKLHNHIVSSTI